MPIAIDDLRRFAVSRTFFSVTLPRAIDRLGFVQADPIRSPARAQDLILRHRVSGYRAGDLERRYEAAGVEEDVLVNYGFVPRAVQALMQPRGLTWRWSATRRKRARALLEFVRERGSAHPREVDEHFAHGTVTNYWGGSSNATTHLLEAMHYAGLLRVARREAGIRIYAAVEYPPPPRDGAGRRARIDALVDVAVGTYAPLPGASLSALVGRLRYAVPRWRGDLRQAVQRARERLAHARVDGIDWYWPEAERLANDPPPDKVRLLAPFDPGVWDRRRFRLLWDWEYRFEAYTPPAKRKIGYYALPLLWRDQMIGWGNLAVKAGTLQASFGYVQGRAPDDSAFSRELEAELERVRQFLELGR
ncbi:MAG TPA: crosslink repair DNA glycosylase YcaQ family protein [Vicinamibacterales bacterium]|nr:crosslink repair DNA glycosylase YcaQ family protein [Vicinamibacterales bacterium]